MPQLLKPVKAATLAIGLTMCATTALACAFHSYVPDETVVDKMLGSDHIVLARPASCFRRNDVTGNVFVGHSGNGGNCRLQTDCYRSVSS